MVEFIVTVMNVLSAYTGISHFMVGLTLMVWGSDNMEMLNLAIAIGKGEEEMATIAIGRILRYGKPVNPQTEADTGGPVPGDEMEASLEAPPAGETAPEAGETETTPAGEIPAELL